MAAIQKIKAVVDRWFITEPLLFSTYCTHELVENAELGMPFRTGNRRIEYSPKIIEKLDSEKVEEWLRLEIYRILLGHPYHRIPKGAEKKRSILLLTSDITINHFYKARVETSGVRFFKDNGIRFNLMKHPLGYRYGTDTEEYQFFKRNIKINDDTTSPHYGDLETVDDLSFEQWYRRVNFLISWTANGSGDDENTNREKEEVEKTNHKPSDKFNFSKGADLWQENQEMLSQVQETINKAAEEKEWGKIDAGLKAEILANAVIPVDYRKILSRFKSSILAANRQLTRMRPNRRFGYKQMGCRYEKKAKILIAVDVSGSIGDKSLNQFFSIIREFFKYGIDRLDVIQFDSKIQRKTKQLKNDFETMKVIGRGGTDFNPPVNYYINHPEYDGLIIFTDGYGNKPEYSTKRKVNIVWFLTNKEDYSEANFWISRLPGNLATYIPEED